MLKADPHAWRLDRATQLAAVTDALADGVGAARTLRARFAELSPEQIARELGVPVETTKTIRWWDRSGGLLNIGHGRRALCSTDGG